MKKLILALSFLFLVQGCTSASGALAIVNPFNPFNSMFYPLLIVGELETNLSSLVIDKTKVKVVNFKTNPFEVLPERSLLYVMPAIINKNHTKEYDEYYGNMLKNYILMNNFAIVTNDISKADFVLMATITESPERTLGTNFSNVQVSILDVNEKPVFLSSIQLKSSSDRNFYYHPSKSARPVKELTLVGLENIFKSGLPQAFGLEER